MRLKPVAIQLLKDAIIHNEINSLPEEFLTSLSYCEHVEFDVYLDENKKFDDRYQLGLYLDSELSDEQLTTIDKDAGVWTWICCLYFAQLSKRTNGKYSGIEHYIYSPGRSEYRHCVATPTRLVTQFEKEFARLVISNKINDWGDMAEQITSRQYLMRCPSYRKLIMDLYINDDTGLAKPGAASGSSSKKLKSGKRSKSGQGSVRRLALELKRLAINYKTDSMTSGSIQSLLNPEYEKFNKWNLVK